MACKCFKCSRHLPSSNVDPHLSCLSCREVFCSLASRYDSCRDLSHDQFQRLLVGIKDRMERKMASASAATGKRKSSSSSQQLDKRMCRMEETLDSFPRSFSILLQALHSRVSCHLPPRWTVPSRDQVVHRVRLFMGVRLVSAIRLPCPAAISPPRIRRSASVIQLPCLAARLLSGILLMASVTAPMPGGHQLNPRPGLSFGKANPGHQAGGLGHGQSVSVPGDLLPAQDMSIAVSHMAPMILVQRLASLWLPGQTDSLFFTVAWTWVRHPLCHLQLLCLVALISRALGLAMSLCLQSQMAILFPLLLVRMMRRRYLPLRPLCPLLCIS